MKFVRAIAVFILGLACLVWAIAFLSLTLESHEYTEFSKAQLAEAKAYLDKNFQPLPNDWQWSRLVPEPGVELRTGFLDADNPKGTVVFVPGFTSPIEMQASAIRAFHQAGYKVAALDYRGQGGSWRPLDNPEKGYLESYTVLADDVAKFARDQQVPNKPLFIFAISKGAHISMRMAERDNNLVSAYALAVPMIEIGGNGANISTLKFLSSAATVLGLGSAYPPGLSNWPPKNFKIGEATDCNANPDTAQIQDALFAFNKELRVSSVTMRWLKETIESSEHLMSPAAAAKITQPVIIFNAGDERVVNADAAMRFCDVLNNCKLKQLPGSRHCINREDYAVFDQILGESIALFDSISTN